jgi:hypothetical protein
MKTLIGKSIAKIETALYNPTDDDILFQEVTKITLTNETVLYFMVDSADPGEDDRVFASMYEISASELDKSKFVTSFV